MFDTVMMWLCLILIGIIAIGFFICCVLMLMGMIFQRKDKEMFVVFGIALILCSGICTGLVFASIAMGRNLV